MKPLDYLMGDAEGSEWTHRTLSIRTFTGPEEDLREQIGFGEFEEYRVPEENWALAGSLLIISKPCPGGMVTWELALFGSVCR